MDSYNQTLTQKIKQALIDNVPNIKTPCYVFDASIVKERFLSMKASLGTDLICSIKANPNNHLLAFSHDVVTHKEIASLKELSLVVSDAGVIYANNPSMSDVFMRSAVAAKARLVIDSLEQLEMVEKYATTKAPEPLMLRLNPCVLVSFAPNFNVRLDHFGMDLDTAMQAIDLIKNSEYLSLAGFHLFVGSYSFKKSSLKVAEAAPQILSMFETRYGSPMQHINLGGGFSEYWPEDDEELQTYKNALLGIPSHVNILHESGRGIYASCGAFLTTVVRHKTISGKHYAVCDGGLNQNFLLGQTENRFASPKVPVVIRHTSCDESSDAVKTVLVGSTCSKDDVIGQFEGPPLAVGDQCLFLNCGAYNSTYTVSNFLGLQEPEFYVFP